MKRSFTSLAILALLTTTTSNAFSQCLTGGSFTAASTNTFDFTSEGFSGAFAWSSGGSGQLESTPVSAGLVKELKSITYFLPNTATTIAWSFNLSGTANVTSYTVEALYNAGGTLSRVPVCSGGVLTTTGSNLVFAAVAPSEIVGQRFQLIITFTSTSNGNKILVVDNFRTNGFTSAITLPVNITYFNAAAVTGGIKLTWMVSDESNVNRYEIERSSNGKSYSKIGQVSASGVVSYTYTDAAYNTGSNYYRLKAVDNDGKFKYSSVVLFKVGRKGLSLRAYPSPASTEVTIQHDIATEISQISIISMDGRLVELVKPAPGKVETTISLEKLQKGFYMIRYTNSEGEVETVKLVKQ